MPKYVKDIDLGLKEFKRQVNLARNAEVLVGVHEGSVNHNGQSIAEYGAYNEYGTSKIPERSFMRTAFDESIGDLSIKASALYTQITQGKTTVYKALSILGLQHSNDIKNVIVGRNILPRLSPSTIKRKGSAKTLVDTGALKNSIHHKVNIK